MTNENMAPEAPATKTPRTIPEIDKEYTERAAIGGDLQYKCILMQGQIADNQNRMYQLGKEKEARVTYEKEMVANAQG